MIGLVGEGTTVGWPNDDNPTPDIMLTQSSFDPHIWYVKDVQLSEAGIKFRANQTWDVNWGGGENFPSGQATGDDIIVSEAGNYEAWFNDLTGRYIFIPTGDSGAEFQISIDKLFNEDVENKDAEPIYDYSFRYNFQEKTAGRVLANKDKLILKGRSLSGQAEKIQIALLMKNGTAFGKIVELKPEVQEIEIDLSELTPVETVTLPRPYPGFLPYYFKHNYSGDFKIEEVESIQFSIGPGIERENLQKPHKIGIRSVRLE
jgi:hypothetical protein